MVFVRPMEEWVRISLEDEYMYAHFLRAHEDVWSVYTHILIVVQCLDTVGFCESFECHKNETFLYRRF
jgi:hypothetical protein